VYRDLVVNGVTFDILETAEEKKGKMVPKDDSNVDAAKAEIMRE